MAVTYTKSTTASGIITKTSVTSGYVTLQINSVASDIPGYVPYNNIDVIADIRALGCGLSSVSAGAAATIVYSWFTYGGSTSWKSSTILSSSAAGILTSISNPSYGNSASIESLLQARINYALPASGTIDIVWFADLKIQYSNI